MLATIRDRASGWIAGVIVGALIISFAFWGVSFYFGDGPELKVATVNGNDITQRSFQRSFYNLRQQMQSMFGGSLSLEEEELIKQQTLQRLIDTEIVNQIVQQQGLRVTDATVVGTIKNLDPFKDDGGFDRSRYERGIMSLGMEPAYFENQLRMDLLSEQLQAGLSESLFVLDNELQNILRLRLQTRDITYAILEQDMFLDDVEISDDEIETFYQSNPQRYVEPEKVKIAYVELDVNKLAESIETDEEDLRAYYNDNRNKYDVVEQRSVTKLFVKTAEEDADKNIVEESDEVKAKAREVIESALAMVNDGKTFEEIVEGFSDEGKAALQFSEHAFMSKDIMQKEVDEFLFSADEGAVSDVIETKTGLNIVKVGEIRGGPKNTYENAAEAVEKDYRLEQAELQFFDFADQLTTLSYEHLDTLDIAAEAIGQKLIESDYFDRENSNEDITSNANVLASSFDSELISSGQNSDAIEIANNHIVVLRVLDHKPASTKPLEDVREQVISHIKFDRALEKIEETGDAIVAQLESGATIESLQSDIEIEWLNAEKVQRDDVGVNRAVLRNAFQLGKPEQNKPVIAGQVLGSGDYAIVMVTAAYDGDVATDDEELKTSLDNELRRARGNSEWQELLNNAKNNADVTVYDENI